MMRPGLALLVVSMVSFETTWAWADAGKVFYQDVHPGQGDSIDESTEARVAVRRDLERIWEVLDPTVTYAVNSNILFMHKCTGSSCTVRRAGSTNSSAVPDQSTIVCRPGTSCAAAGQGTLSPFSRSQAVWDQTMACMREVFAPFGVTVTDVDPGSQPHYEIMIGGQPGQLGFGSNTGGVSPAICGNQIPSSLVFVFDVWGNNVNEICATAAQEIAHSWALDHVTDASDPMTYFAFAGRRRFVNANVPCGSDCENGLGPDGQTCTGTGLQTRTCSCGGTTQNSVQMIKALFGDGTPTPPTVAITMPMANQSVYPGFHVVVDASDDMGIMKIELYLDDVLLETRTPTLAMKSPFEFIAPNELAEGPHTVKVTVYDVIGTPTTTTTAVVVAPPCGKPADCPSNTDTCIGGRCVPGPGVQGGLGSECTESIQCASGQCAVTTEGAYCVEPCQLGGEQCPNGFGCLDAGANDGTGVCYPGFDEGGCLDAGGNGAPVTAGLGFAALLFARRRRRS